MRPITLWRYEARRTGWAAVLGPPLAVALGIAAALAYPEPSDTTTARILLGGLEMAVPLAAAVVCSTLIGQDPAREVQLTVPTPYRITLLRRMIVVLSWTAAVAVLAAAVLIVTGWWARWPQNHGAFAGQLTWLAPMLGLSGLGFAAGAVLRSPAAAGAIVTTVWAIQQFFADAVQEHLPGRLLYLFATTRGAATDDWLANRLVLVGAGAVLVALALILLGRPERLISEEDE
ncbi:putative outer membrane lipoprotein [Actinoplanes campanulatus]|uniref:Putative outer membrane lipoprotein n=1 Tax=Actinoplanes campanulatus TaxID=113559 RepID=A0A7W5FJ19_9ACTN|nr:hypothetical protein [Actinoplanes campanulatus]MBB3100269.1 putative outer membrane lipoprotein [Actinoplanes campanulatus]GGN44134.1 hypothetical protein GCM10010109_77000 [Actinoplanes campanulatus]GID40928.1 hypothetical protein Aca09nite_74340 [Actinoplanes campanulatus]